MSADDNEWAAKERAMAELRDAFKRHIASENKKMIVLIFNYKEVYGNISHLHIRRCFEAARRNVLSQILMSTYDTDKLFRQLTVCLEKIKFHVKASKAKKCGTKLATDDSAINIMFGGPIKYMDI